jgi:bacillithiol biosynthesis cysteine-adding enzyme BshC
MEHSCIRHTDLPNTTKLFSDFLYHPDRVTSFYPYLPLTPESFRHAADSLDFPRERRRALVEAMRVQNSGNPLLERLARPETVAVVTGQQAGLFSGPHYSVYKALTAVRLAGELTASGIPAVPVFWIATEDHDFEEVNHAWFFDSEFRPVSLETTSTPRGHQPVGSVRLEGVPLDGLRHALSRLPFADEAFELARETYRPGETFGSAFGALLGRLMDGFPILRVDPLLPEFRALAAPVLRDAVFRAPDLTAALLRRNQSLVEAGYHAQVHVENSTSLFFLMENGQRLALRRENGNYLAGSRKIAAEELAGRAAELSPNALLRPVVQDSMIPNIAYIGGPAELAYLAQSEVLYRDLLGRQPVAAHRASFTILDAPSRKRLDRYQLELTDFFHGEEAVREKAARTLVDPQLVSRISQARNSAVASLGTMAADLENFDQSITKALEKGRRKIEYQFGKIGRKVEREAMSRNERASRDVAALIHLLFPRHKPQERVYSTLAMIAQHGPDLVRRIHEQATLDCPDHQVVTI